MLSFRRAHCIYACTIETMSLLRPWFGSGPEEGDLLSRHIPQLAIFGGLLTRVDDDYYIVKGPYGLNVTADEAISTLAKKYKDMGGAEILNFAVAELMQNVMDWALEYAGVRYAGNDKVGFFMRDRSSKLDIETGEHGVEITTRLKDRIVTIGYLKGIGLCFVQSGVDMPSANTFFVMSASSKTDTPGIVSGGGFGVGLKQIFMLHFTKTAYPALEIWGTIAGKGGVNHVRSVLDGSKIVTLVGDVSDYNEEYDEILGKMKVGKAGSKLIHVLRKVNPAECMKCVVQSHVSLMYTDSDIALRFHDACVFKIGAGRIYVNGIYSGLLEVPYGERSDDMPDVLVIGDISHFTSESRGRVSSRNVIERIMARINMTGGFSNEEDEQKWRDELGETCARSDRASRFLRAFSTVAVKRAVLNSRTAQEALSRRRSVYQREEIDPIVRKLKNAGWLPESHSVDYGTSDPDVFVEWLYKSPYIYEENDFYTPPPRIANVTSFCHGVLDRAADNNKGSTDVLSAFNSFAARCGSLARVAVWTKDWIQGEEDAYNHFKRSNENGITEHIFGRHVMDSWAMLETVFELPEGAPFSGLAFAHFKIHVGDCIQRGMDVPWNDDIADSITLATRLNPMCNVADVRSRMGSIN